MFVAVSGSQVVRVALWSIYEPIVFNPGSMSLAEMQAADLAAAGLDVASLPRPLAMKIDLGGREEEEEIILPPMPLAGRVDLGLVGDEEKEPASASLHARGRRRAMVVESSDEGESEVDDGGDEDVRRAKSMI